VAAAGKFDKFDTCEVRLQSPWTLESLSADFHINALKDTYEHSCFLARSNEYQRLMTLTSTPSLQPSQTAASKRTSKGVITQ
jgi:hypothetical protein